MKISCSLILVFLLAGLRAIAFTPLPNNVFQTDGSSADVQAAILAAPSGSMIRLPAGNFTWSNGVTVAGKAIKIAGAGAGGLFANSTTSVTVGTGPQTFIVNNSGFQNINPGMTVTVFYTDSGEPGGTMGNPPVNMTGTVSSFDGTTLVLNVTNAVGSGTYGIWCLGTPSSTFIQNSCTAGPTFDLFEPPAGNVELTGIRIVATGLNSAVGNEVTVEDGGGLALIHDCWFEVANVGSCAILSHANHGIVYHNSFDNKFDSAYGSNNGGGNNDQAFSIKAGALTSSWTQNSTMGMDDIGGTNNFYFEDNYEAGFWTAGTDFDDNSRVVVRHNVFDESVTSTHGYDTSPYGLRHFELYNNTFVFVAQNDNHTFNLNWWIYLRGGTGVIFSNTMPNIISSTWGDKAELTFVDMAPYRVRCTETYPTWHQIGQSWSNGVPITDPVYIWNNLGLPANQPNVAAYPPNAAESCFTDSNPAPWNTTNSPPISIYLQAGRDFVNAPKPGYAPYPYPHPLRASNNLIPPPTQLRAFTP